MNPRAGPVKKPSPFLIISSFALEDITRFLVTFDSEKDVGKRSTVLQNITTKVNKLFEVLRFDSECDAIDFLICPLFCTWKVGTPKNFALNANHWVVGVYEVSTFKMYCGEGLEWSLDSARIYSKALYFLVQHLLECYVKKTLVSCMTSLAARPAQSIFRDWQSLVFLRLPFPRQEDGVSCGTLIAPPVRYLL